MKNVQKLFKINHICFDVVFLYSIELFKYVFLHTKMYVHVYVHTYIPKLKKIYSI